MEKGLGRKDVWQKVRRARSITVELVVSFGALLIVDSAFGQGDRLFSVCPHPFGAVVVLVAAQYGAAGGLAAAIVASALLLVGNLPAPLASEDYYGYWRRLVFNPILWSSLALLVGTIANRHLQRFARALREREEAARNAELIATRFTKLESEKFAAELALSSNRRTALQALSAARLLAEERSFTEGVDLLVSSMIEAKKWSFFAAGPSGLHLVHAFGWEQKDSFQRFIPPGNPLYQEIYERNRPLSASNPKDDAALSREGVLAVPVRHPFAPTWIIGMLKVEAIAAASLTKDTAELLVHLAEWVSYGYHYSKGRAEERVAA